MSAGTRRAGLCQRSVAWSIDAVLLAPVAWLLSRGWSAPAPDLAGHARLLLGHAGHALGAAMAGGTTPDQLAATLLRDTELTRAIAAMQSAAWAWAWPPVLAFALLGAAYHATMERSRWHGSIGKRVLGLRVLDLHGRPLRVGRALLRHASGALSWLTFNIGHAFAALPPGHLALHDRCSGTQVLAASVAPPRWATAWLATLALIATTWLASNALDAMRVALEQALY